jgi:hypothetical protein
VPNSTAGLSRPACSEPEPVEHSQNGVACVTLPLRLVGVAGRSVSVREESYRLISLGRNIEPVGLRRGLSQLTRQIQKSRCR